MAQNCLYIGTVLPFRRKSISVILGTVKTLHSSRSGLEWLFSISVKVVVSILFQKARRVLNNERGEANYFSTVVFIFIAVLLLAFIIDLFSIISTKQELDHAADQMVKQIQLSGGVNSETDETVVLLSKGEVDSKKIRVEFSLEDMDMSEFQDGATYPQIKEYVLEHTGLKVSNLYISQIKRKCGIGVGKNYNLPKSEDSRQPQCPQEKEKAIREAFKYFGMI